MTESRSRFRFSIAPKSFQKNPEVDFNVVTEMTEYGRKLKKPTPQKPVYYVLQSGYYQNLGEAAPANMKPPPMAILQHAMKDALKQKNYIEAGEGTVPTLVIIFNYGDHSATNAETEVRNEAGVQQAAHQQAAVDRLVLEASIQMTDEARGDLPAFSDPPEMRSDPTTVLELLPYVLSDPRKHQQVIERAALIGGVSFGKELADALKREVASRRMAGDASRSLNAIRAERDRQAFINASLGSSTELPMEDPPSFMLESASPFYRYYNRDTRTTHLVEEAFGSCYFVIASAYDGAAIAKGERRLLWRTKMTVNSSGVSMADTLPTLIHAAAPHFGERMEKVITVTKRVVRSGEVNVGAETVIEESLPEPSASEGKARQ
jgi:hypothetical protein